VQIAILLYDRFTALDAVGPYEVLARMPDTTVVFVSERPGPVRADTGMLALTADAALADVPHPDIVLVPGGPGQDDQMSDGAVHQWLRAADAASSWTSSVCTGSLILAAAGLLAGRRATSHWLALDELRQFGVTPVSQRVDDMPRRRAHEPGADRAEERRGGPVLGDGRRGVFRRTAPLRGRIGRRAPAAQMKKGAFGATSTATPTGTARGPTSIHPARAGNGCSPPTARPDIWDLR